MADSIKQVWEGDYPFVWKTDNGIIIDALDCLECGKYPDAKAPYDKASIKLFNGSEYFQLNAGIGNAKWYAVNYESEFAPFSIDAWDTLNGLSGSKLSEGYNEENLSLASLKTCVFRGHAPYFGLTAGADKPLLDGTVQNSIPTAAEFFNYRTDHDYYGYTCYIIKLKNTGSNIEPYLNSGNANRTYELYVNKQGAQALDSDSNMVIISNCDKLSDNLALPDVAFLILQGAGGGGGAVGSGAALPGGGGAGAFMLGLFNIYKYITDYSYFCIRVGRGGIAGDTSEGADSVTGETGMETCLVNYSRNLPSSAFLEAGGGAGGISAADSNIVNRGAGGECSTLEYANVPSYWRSLIELNGIGLSDNYYGNYLTPVASYPTEGGTSHARRVGFGSNYAECDFSVFNSGIKSTGAPSPFGAGLEHGQTGTAAIGSGGHGGQINTSTAGNKPQNGGNGLAALVW